MKRSTPIVVSAAIWFGASLAAADFANGQELPGVTDTEIRIGHILPYTGPAAAWGPIGTTIAAYFRMINDLGGINGRSVVFISYDDGFSTPRTVEAARRLVERDDVLLIFQSAGVQQNLAIRDYLNELGVPQLFMANSATVFDDPVNYPWSMRWNPTSTSEAKAFADHILAEFVEARIGVLYENDEWSREYLQALTERLNGRFEIVSQIYDITDPTVDAQVLALQAAGVDVFLNFAGPRFAAQAIQRAAEIQWHPYHIIASVSSGIEQTFLPAGFENAVGIVSLRYQKDTSDPANRNDPDVAEFQWFWENYNPGTGEQGIVEVYAFSVAAALVSVLRRCGDDLSRANVMRQATNLVALEVPLLLPGITVNTSPTDYAPLEQFRMSRFDGVSFVNFGPLIDTAND